MDKPNRGFQEAPAGLADVSLVDLKAISAATGFSRSHFLNLVSKGRAPKPFFRRARCTRWRQADIRVWLAGLGDEAASQ